MLKELNLDHNKIRALPPEIKLLTNLTKLSAVDNLLTDLPEEIGDMHWLEVGMPECKLILCVCVCVCL